MYPRGGGGGGGGGMGRLGKGTVLINVYQNRGMEALAILHKVLSSLAAVNIAPDEPLVHVNLDLENPKSIRPCSNTQSENDALLRW